MKMTMRAVFTADDGTEFLDDDACVRYERSKTLTRIISDHTVYQDNILDMTELVNAILDWVGQMVEEEVGADGFK